MRESMKRSQKEHAATLAATVRRTLDQESAPPSAAEAKAPSRAGPGRVAAGIVVLLVGASLGLVLLRPTPEPAPAAAETVGYFEIARGGVDVVPASSGASRPFSLEPGEPIAAGTVLDTRSASGRAAFRLADGASVRLDRDSRVVAASTSVLRLERGAVYIDAAAVGAAVEVRTTLGVVRDIGTQFEVRLLTEAGRADERLRVRVREGTIVLERGGGADEASAGEELALGNDGNLIRGTVPVYGAHWDWVLETAPVPEAEGRPLRAFLDWVTREGGWTLEFADPETAELASTIVLHGDLRGLTPTDAAAMALKSSRLGYRVEDGAFVVGPTGF